MEDLTAIMISFMRPEFTKECVRTLSENYPGIKILVGENCQFNEDLCEFVKKYGARYIVLPFDSGVCIARNRLMEFVDTEFVLVGDDDFFYTPEANVDKMLAFLKNKKQFSLVGGRIFESGNVKNYQGHIRIFDDHFEYENIDVEGGKFDRKSGIRYQRVDITFNYFVARTEDIRPVKWDEKIKVAFEHSDWFIGLKKAGIKVAFTPDAIVKHKPEHIKCERMIDYSAYRNRRSDEHRFFEKHGIKYSIGFRGVKYRPRQQKRHDVPVAYYAKKGMTYNGRNYNPGEIIHTTEPNELMNPCF